MKHQKKIVQFILVGMMAAGFSACQGKKSPPSEREEEGGSDCGCYGNNDQSALFDPEETSRVLHRVEPATDVSDVKISEKKPEAIEDRSIQEPPQEVVVQETVTPIAID